MAIRNVNLIGNMWPLCKSCGHIAQSHDATSCSELTYGKCPACGVRSEKAPCDCKGYDGPTLRDFMTQYLTPEEREHYAHLWKLKDEEWK